MARILNSKLDLQVLVPVAGYFQLSVFDPLGIILNDAFDLEVGLDIEFLQSEPDCEKFMASFRVEPDLATQILHGLDLCAYDMFPVFVIGKKHAVIFRGPAFGTIGPVRSCQMQDFP